MLSRLTRAVANLAASPGRPSGDPACALELILPLTPDGQLDADAAVRLTTYCRVALLQAGVPVWSSPLLRIDPGWAVRPGGTEAAPLWPLDIRTVRPGEYLTLSPPEADAQVFRIVNVGPP